MIGIQPSVDTDTLKTWTPRGNHIFCLFPRLTRLSVSVSSISSLHLSSLLFLTIQDSLFSSWPEGATGCWCQIRGHRMGAVIIIARTLSCQCALQQNNRDPLEVLIKSFGLWSGGKRRKKKPKHCKINEECPKERVGEWKRQLSRRRPQLLLCCDVLMSGAQVFGPCLIWPMF